MALLSCQSPRKEVAIVNSPSDSAYLAIGNKIASITFDTLRGSLLKAIEQYGVDGAISFCNERATGLVNTYADSVSVRRTSLRVRNQHYKADSLERMVLQNMHAAQRAGELLSEKIIRHNEEIHFFKPIKMQAFCLSCHGSTTTHVQPGTKQNILNLYPADSAINYAEGDLRGMWHITFSKNDTSNH